MVELSTYISVAAGRNAVRSARGAVIEGVSGLSMGAVGAGVSIHSRLAAGMVGEHERRERSTLGLASLMQPAKTAPVEPFVHDR